MLIVHHLGRAQSERVVWLCEELGLPYELRRYARDRATLLAPPELKALHPIGTAPVVQDGDVVLAESAAVVEYILARHGGGALVVPPASADFPHYLVWFHFANGTLQPAMSRSFTLRRLESPPEHPVTRNIADRLRHAWGLVEARLAVMPYLAGERFSAADIMTVFSLTTMRHFTPVDLAPFPAIRAYLARIGERPGYRAAMAKADPGDAPMLA